MILVTKDTFAETILHLEKQSKLALDTETTGLHWVLGHRLFSIIVADKSEEYYFNFIGYKDLSSEFVLPYSCVERFQRVLDNIDLLVFANPKFDMHMLCNEGVRNFPCEIYDVLTADRLHINNHMKYDLAHVAERWGFEKLTTVEEYLRKNRLKKDYTKVPWEMITEYGCRDARITYDLHDKIPKQEANSKFTNKSTPTKTEMDISKVCFDMERKGVKIDRAYCSLKIQELEVKVAQYEETFLFETGRKLVDSSNCLKEVFSLYLDHVPLTKTGYKFDSEVLAGFDNPLADIVLKWRTESKLLNTYFMNFIKFTDAQDYLHCNYRQSGTATGRFSSSDPNMQNIPKSGGVRDAILPSQGNVLVMIDYNQMEFRMMLDYAKERDLINLILDGHDPHQATADLTGLTRSQAKTLNFALLYGMGINSLALSLGCTVKEAKKFKREYFSGLEYVQIFLLQVKSVANTEKVIEAWSGRKFDWPECKWTYKAPNYLIQGGTADVVKQAMIEVHELLRFAKSEVKLQVHDEIVFDMCPTECDILIPKILEIMENIYPYRKLPLTCSVEHSWTNWGSPVEGVPSEQEHSNRCVG